MFSTYSGEWNASKSSTESSLTLNSRLWAGSTCRGALRIVRFCRHANWGCSGWCNLICLSRQLSEVDVFRHEISGHQEWVFSGIVDATRGVEYALWTGTKVGAGPEQPGGCNPTILPDNLRDLLSLNTITTRFLTCQELQKRCTRNVLPYYE